MSNNSLTILIAEDDPATKALLDRFLTNENHHLIHAADGQEAVALYKIHQPDIVICDVNMPVMSGLEAIEHVRSYTKTYWVPILVISAYDESAAVIKALNAGADDYLSKPFNLDVLRAKINVMQRLVNLQRTNQRQLKSLKKAHDEIENEQILAKNLANKMLDMGDLPHSAIEYWLKPATHFSGDLISACEAVGNKLYILLADSTGHGLGASLPTLLISRIFHTMTRKGFNLPSLVTEMNNITKSMLTPDRFVALNIFAIDYDHQTIEGWCGGLPDSFVVNQQGEIAKTFKSDHLAIGILGPDEFDATTKLWQWQEPVELFAYTDGVVDVTDSEGNLLGEDNLLKTLLSAASGHRVEQVKEAVLQHADDLNDADDISLVCVQCKPDINLS